MLCVAVSRSGSGSSKVRQDLSLPASSASVCGASSLRKRLSMKVTSSLTVPLRVWPLLWWDLGIVVLFWSPLSFPPFFLSFPQCLFSPCLPRRRLM